MSTNNEGFLVEVIMSMGGTAMINWDEVGQRTGLSKRGASNKFYNIRKAYNATKDDAGPFAPGGSIASIPRPARKRKVDKDDAEETKPSKSAKASKIVEESAKVNESEEEMEISSGDEPAND